MWGSLTPVLVTDDHSEASEKLESRVPVFEKILNRPFDVIITWFGPTAPLLSGGTAFDSLAGAPKLGPLMAVPGLNAAAAPRGSRGPAPGGGAANGQLATAGASAFSALMMCSEAPPCSCRRSIGPATFGSRAVAASISATVTVLPTSPVHGTPTTYSSGLRFCGIAPRKSS